LACILQYLMAREQKLESEKSSSVFSGRELKAPD